VSRKREHVTASAIHEDAVLVVNPYANPLWIEAYDHGTKIGAALRHNALIVRLPDFVARLRELGIRIPAAFHYEFQSEMHFEEIPHRASKSGQRGQRSCA
jgi:hypothetical protein